MNIKDLVISLGLALLTVWGVQYFFFNKGIGSSSSDGQAQSFVVPAVKQEFKPLNVEVDFLDTEDNISVEYSEVATHWGRVTFSTGGGGVVSLLHNLVNGRDEVISSFDLPESDRSEVAFLLALDQQTPYYYKLVKRQDRENSTILTYQARTQAGTFKKQFTVYQDLNKIDLALTIEPANGAIEPRIFFPGPLLYSQSDDKRGISSKEEEISAIILGSKDSFEKITRDKLDNLRGWYNPHLFGADNRYFVHALVTDPNNFAQRAYYRFVGKDGLGAIVEGQRITSPTTWHMSFYVGPKEISAMSAVDPRLEATFNYWWPFSVIANVLLKILNWLYYYLGNYGFAIVVLTLLIRLILFPMTYRGEADMKRSMEMRKKIAYLKQKYKNDPQRLAQEQAELIKKYGMPGMGGCLPVILIQLPLFFVLSRVLANAVEMYHAPMLWINDLSAPDPFYVLPMIVCIAMLLQAVLARDATQRISGIIMALVFGAVTANFAAGLALYIAVSVLLAVGQTALVKRFRLAE